MQLCAPIGEIAPEIAATLREFFARFDYDAPARLLLNGEGG
jgi:hypothetical protein